MKTYDAIIVGSGACGSWAAMELCKAGMQVLMLEAGSKVDPATDFQHKHLYELDYRGNTANAKFPACEHPEHHQ